MIESFVALAESLAPGCADTWVGADEDAVEEVEYFAGRPLPAFYRWFLETMGNDMGALGHAYLDLRPATIAAAYDAYEYPRGASALYIGRHPEPRFPFRQFLDLDAPCREDAAVLEEPEDGGPRTRPFETLREQLAWGLVVRFRLAVAPQQFLGGLADPGGDVAEALWPALASLGWTRMLEDTGRYCGLYQRGDEVLLASAKVDATAHDRMVVQAGSRDATSMRKLLGQLSMDADLQVAAVRWEPPLPEPE
ncbi:MAG: hypothetical protein AAGA54_35800 [Myxococcota bacterium]